MSTSTEFEIVVTGGNKNTRTIAAFIVEQALHQQGFVDIETIEPKNGHKEASLLNLVREIDPLLFTKHVVVQEITTLPSIQQTYQHYTSPVQHDADPFLQDDPELVALMD